MTNGTDNKKATLELGTKPVGRLLWQYALPAIIAMSASSLYNIIGFIQDYPVNLYALPHFAAFP